MPRLSPGDALLLGCGAELPNRLMKAAMTEGLADVAGHSTPALETLYRRWSDGGAGLLITGNVMVDRRYLERPGNLVIDDNGGTDKLHRLAQAGTAAGNHLWMQISHPGRQCSRLVNNRPVSPSPVRLKILNNFARPRALETEEIPQIIDAYARAAQTAQQTSFTGVQIHAAHGYLISQFLSPLTNVRNDEWGGDLQHRARFLIEVVRAVRNAVGPQYPVAVKLNSADFQRGGFSLSESCLVAQMLEKEDIDLLEISGGTYEQPRLLGQSGDPQRAESPITSRESTRQREAYFLQYAQAIRAVCSIPMAVTGGFRDAAAMQQALDNGELDVVGMARPFCMEPDIAARLLTGQTDSARRDEQNLGLGRLVSGRVANFGPFRALTAQGAAAWYYRQMIRLSRGQDADPQLGFKRALLRHFVDEYSAGFARRRARRQATAC